MAIYPVTSPRLRRAASALAVGSFFVAQAVQACPGCKQAVGGDGAGGKYSVNSVGIGYALSIGFLLFMIAFAVGSIGFMAYRNCQALAAQHQAAAEAAFAARGRA